MDISRFSRFITISNIFLLVKYKNRVNSPSSDSVIQMHNVILKFFWKKHSRRELRNGDDKSQKLSKIWIYQDRKLLYKSTSEYGCHRALPDVLQVSDLHF